ncbi:hypothetical protein D623_10010522 [Myotis brandtii]|uniref:Uncharacterized protein n=1 Tax=Myotis brandtii TaxID=109478 RepID=S7NGV6_MYOBR|nr:hypothetical protein D623_10010522 [Myotis brandtii]
MGVDSGGAALWNLRVESGHVGSAHPSLLGARIPPGKAPEETAIAVAVPGCQTERTRVPLPGSRRAPSSAFRQLLGWKSSRNVCRETWRANESVHFAYAPPSRSMANLSTCLSRQLSGSWKKQS